MLLMTTTDAVRCRCISDRACLVRASVGLLLTGRTCSSRLRLSACEANIMSALPVYVHRITVRGLQPQLESTVCSRFTEDMYHGFLGSAIL